MTCRHSGTAGSLLTLALAAGLSGPCLAQEDAAPRFSPNFSQGFSLAQTGDAAVARSPLDPGPCLDAPGCGRRITPLMPAPTPPQALKTPDENPSAVPLPAALALMGAAMAAFAMLRRRPATG